MSTSVGKMWCCCGTGTGWQQVAAFAWWPGWKGFLDFGPIPPNNWQPGFISNGGRLGRERPFSHTKYLTYHYEDVLDYVQPDFNTPTGELEIHQTSSVNMGWHSIFGDLDSADITVHSESTLAGVTNLSGTWNRSSGVYRGSDVHVIGNGVLPSTLPGPGTQTDGTVNVGKLFPYVDPPDDPSPLVSDRSIAILPTRCEQNIRQNGLLSGRPYSYHFQSTIRLEDPYSIDAAASSAVAMLGDIPLNEVRDYNLQVMGTATWQNAFVKLFRFGFPDQVPSPTAIPIGTNFIAIYNRRQSNGRYSFGQVGTDISLYPEILSSVGNLFNRPIAFDSLLGPGDWWDWPSLRAMVVAIKTSLRLPDGLRCSNANPFDFETVVPLDLGIGGTGSILAPICGLQNLAPGTHNFLPQTLKARYGESVLNLVGGTRPNCCP